MDSKPKPWGCAHYGVIAILCFALLCYVAWECFFKSVPLRISPETTYITEPLSANGKWVDYFKAMELKLYPPGMKTDENGARVLVRALGIGESTSPEFARIFYEKLGLDISVPPTHFFIGPNEYYKRAKTYMPEVAEAQKRKMYDRYVKRTLDEFRANPSRPAEESERLIQEWEESLLQSEEEKTPEIPGGVGMGSMSMGMGWSGMMSMGNELPKDYASWEPDVHNEFYKFNTPWTVEENPLLEHWLHDMTPALEIITEAARKPAFMFPKVRLHEDDHFVMISVLLPSIQSMRAYARDGLVIRANYRIAQGDFDGAFEDILTIYHLGRRVGYDGFTVSALVGIALEGIAHSIDFNFPGDKQPTAEQLRRFLSELENLPPRVEIETCFEFERFMGLESVQSIMRIAASGRFGDADMGYLLGMNSAIIPRVLSVVGVNWNIVFRHVNEAYDDLIAGTLDYNAYDVNNNFFQRPQRILTLNSRSVLVANAFESLLLPAVEAVGEAMRRTECVDNLKRLTLASLIYEKEHGTWPDGHPLHSWRVLLLPYLGEEAKELYEKIRLDEKWDSEHNKQFHETSLRVFQCPSANRVKMVDGGTHYSVIVRNDPEFGLDKKNRLLIVERQEAVCWMKPDEEITQRAAEAGINKSPTGLGSYHTGGINVATKAGGINFISQTIHDEKLREIIVGTDSEMP